MKNSETKIRKASREDVPLILDFIKLIAEYEKLSNEVVATVDSLTQAIFGEKSTVEVLLAYTNNIPSGYAVYFHNFSTFVGRKGIYLEDIFVKPEFRGKGIGKLLLKEIAREAVKNNCGRIEWAVLDWNTPTIEFYKSIGAKPMNEWILFRMNEEELKNFAEE